MLPGRRAPPRATSAPSNPKIFSNPGSLDDPTVVSHPHNPLVFQCVEPVLWGMEWLEQNLRLSVTTSHLYTERPSIYRVPCGVPH